MLKRSALILMALAVASAVRAEWTTGVQSTETGIYFYQEFVQYSGVYESDTRHLHQVLFRRSDVSKTQELHMQNWVVTSLTNYTPGTNFHGFQNGSGGEWMPYDDMSAAQARMWDMLRDDDSIIPEVMQHIKENIEALQPWDNGTDYDGDGVPDFMQDQTIDTDGDGTPDWQDTDDDNDGYSDVQEMAAGTDSLNGEETPEDEPDGGGENPGGAGGGGMVGPGGNDGLGGDDGNPEEEQPEVPTLTSPVWPSLEDSTGSALLDALEVVDAGWAGMIPSGSSNPVITVEVTINGELHQFAVPLLPDMGSDVGQALNGVRLLMRGLLALQASLMFFASIWTTLRQY